VKFFCGRDQGRVCQLSSFFCLTVLSAAVVPMNANEVTLVIKSPHHEDAPLRFNISLEGTVRDIKERLSQHHPEHPHPKDQRLIFAGKLLTDSSRTVDVLKQVRERAPSAATAC
jgi:hypothetical protein